MLRCNGRGSGISSTGKEPNGYVPVLRIPDSLPPHPSINPPLGLLYAWSFLHLRQGSVCGEERRIGCLYTWSSLSCVCDSYYWQTAIWQPSSNKNRRRNADSAKYKEALTDEYYSRLQKAQNMAAKLIIRSERFEHVTHILE